MFADLRDFLAILMLVPTQAKSTVSSVHGRSLVISRTPCESCVLVVIFTELDFVSKGLWQLLQIPLPMIFPSFDC